MPAPLEVIDGPFTIWLATFGQTFPEIGAAPPGPWVQFGQNGASNYTEPVVIQNSQTINPTMVQGSTVSIKPFREDESCLVQVTCNDMRLENISRVFNGNAVTDVAPTSGSAGYRRLDLKRGHTVQQFALLLRGPSPYGDDFASQVWAPAAHIQSANRIRLPKGEGSAYEVEFGFSDHPDGYLSWLCQDAVAA